VAPLVGARPHHKIQTGLTTRAYAEVDRVLGTDPSVPPNYTQVHQLQYITQILKETLRLWPTAPGFTRHCYADETVIGGKYKISKENPLTVLTPMLHRDKSVWGEDAEEFKPEHFSPEAEQSRPGNAYKPFGSGQRACIGRTFAMQEATLVLGMILQRFQLIDHKHYQLKIKETVTIKPENFKIQIKPRTDFARSVTVVSPSDHRSYLGRACDDLGTGHQSSSYSTARPVRLQPGGLRRPGRAHCRRWQDPRLYQRGGPPGRLRPSDPQGGGSGDCDGLLQRHAAR
jgi:hypothetical protein